MDDIFKTPEHETMDINYVIKSDIQIAKDINKIKGAIAHGEDLLTIGKLLEGLVSGSVNAGFRAGKKFGTEKVIYKDKKEIQYGEGQVYSNRTDNYVGD